jgi:hypothetical protein
MQKYFVTNLANQNIKKNSNIAPNATFKIPKKIRYK